MPVLRFDRLLTLGVFKPAQRAAAQAELRVPVLMYHSISSDTQPGVAPYYKTNTSPAVFERHLRFLTQTGVRSISMTEAGKLLQNKTAAPEKVVVITFDDGFRDFYDEAFPLLKKHSHTAVMFLPTTFISKNRRSFKGTECMTWKEIRELRANGIEFGSHTVNHPVLYDLSWKEIEGELTHSRRQIEHELGEAITNFAYPYAYPQEDEEFTGVFRELCLGAGYRTNVTTAIGRAQPGDDPFSIKRLPMNWCDDEVFLEAKMRGAYDWLAVPQAIIRRAKTWTGRTPPRPTSLAVDAGRRATEVSRP